MLTRLDDYPVHQTPEPLAHPVGNHPNTYDRYFFHGYDLAAGVMFGVALGVYPVRGIIDASFTVVRDGTQRSVHASARAPRERTTTAVGPIRVEVVEPMRRHRVVVDAPDLGIVADLELTARTEPHEEPRQTSRDGIVVTMDSTRLTQWGTWQGSLSVDGVDVDVAGLLGARDRSWGIRPVGAPAPGPPATVLPQFFWLWSPVHLDDRALHFQVQEHADGRRSQWGGAILPLLDDPASEPFTGPPAEPAAGVSWEIDWEPGTRRARAASFTLERWNADPLRVDLVPKLTLLMRGLGYVDPEWGQGHWKGDDATGTRSWVTADEDPLDVRNLHVQHLCEVRVGEQSGVGAFEILAIGEHHPSGLTGFLDGAGG